MSVGIATERGAPMASRMAGDTSAPEHAASPVEPAATVAVVRVEGEVDVAALEACDWLLQQAGEQGRRAVVDLSQASRVELSGVKLLLSRRRRLKAAGGELSVAAGRREVRDVLRAGAGGELPVFVTLDEALAWVRGESATVSASVGARRVRG